LAGQGNKIAAAPAAPDAGGDVWHPSRYIISARGKDSQYIVGSLFTGVVEVISQEVWETYLAPGAAYSVPQDGIPPFLQHLFDQGLLVSAEVDELDRVRVHFQQIRHDISGQRILIAPTLACNLRCSYCFEMGTRKSKDLRPMSMETERLVADYTVAQCEDKQDLIVNWFGGEPLLRMGTIERISESLIDRLDLDRITYRAQITTNGILLDATAVRRLTELLVRECQITVDVPKTNKLDARGRPAMERQLDNIAEASEVMDVKLRVNVGRDIEEEFDSLYAALRSRNLQATLNTLNILPVLPVECGGVDCQQPLAVNQPDEVAFLRRERDKAKAMGFPVSEPFPSAVKPCGATCITQSLIDPQGFIYKCPSDLGIQDRSFASVYASRPIRPQNLLPWLTYDWFRFEDCRDCKLLPRCAGGCPHRRMHRYGGAFCLYDPNGVQELTEVLSAVVYGEK
jgi:uncharacterized protein